MEIESLSSRIRAEQHVSIAVSEAPLHVVTGDLSPIAIRLNGGPGGQATMVIFGLKNHAPDDFKEVTRQEHTSKDGGPIETQSLTPTQRAEQAVRLVDGAVVLTANGLCAILVSALQWPEADVGGYLDALRGRGLLQSGDAPIRTENAALVLLTLVSGFPPTQAVYAALIPLVRPPSGAPCKRCLMLAGSPVTILGVVARLTEI